MVSEKKMLTAALPHLGIVAAHGDTPQALAEDVADQLRFALRHYAQADDATLTPDAQALARRLREWLAGAPATCNPAQADAWPVDALVYCKACHKTHAAQAGEEPCGGPGSWIME